MSFVQRIPNINSGKGSLQDPCSMLFSTLGCKSTSIQCSGSVSLDATLDAPC